jgi:hypothetical protein
MAAARAAERAAERLRPLPHLPKELGPGQRLHTRHVLAGAYRGRDLDYRSTLSHAVLMDGDRDVRLLCSSRVDIADEYSSTPEQGARPPTCPRCLVAWQRLLAGTRGYRANSSWFRLLPTREARLPPAPASIAGRATLGLVVNPKLKVPVLAMTDGEYIGIRSLMQSDLFGKIGTGYPSDMREDSSKFTGLPRVHTPDGVKPRNQGYGTALYSALCLGAHLTYSEHVDIGMKVKGDGVCSDTRDRSEEADAWWRAALARGLTREEVEEIEERKQALTRIAELDDADQRIVHLNEIDVDLETLSERIYDVYEYPTMASRGLLVASFVVHVDSALQSEQLSEVWHTMVDDPQVIEVAYPEPLLALDVRGLDSQTINLLSLLYIKAGLSDQATSAMRERWERNLDPGHVTGQASLFRANAAGVADVMHARDVVDWEELEDLP